MKTLCTQIFLLFCLPALLSAALPSVQYWTDAPRAGWLALSCQTEGASRLTLIQPDGTSGPDFMTDSKADKRETAFYQLPERTLPGSAWWHRSGALHRQLDQIRGTPTAAIWSKNADSAMLRGTQSASQQLPQGGLPIQKLAEAAQLETSDPLIEAYGLRFFAEGDKTLEKALQARFRKIHRSHDQNLRQYERSKDYAPAESIHELRLLDWRTDRCSALVLTRSSRQSAKTSIDIESIHLRRDASDTWQPDNPLNGSVDSDPLREAIRDLLNRQGASGDDFAARFPDPLSKEARRIYTPLRVGDRLYLLFKSYTVAAGAWGTVIISPAKYETSKQPTL